MQFYHSIPEQTKYLCDAAAITSLVVSFTGAISPIISMFASLATLVWMVLRIYESDTVQKLLGRVPLTKEEKKDETK